MVSERSLAVLHAIVSDFVTGGEPVGSRTIVDKYGLGVSAATIRNDMTLLEEEELIVAPHTSSGRIPTDKGYRVYVDTLAKIRPLSTSQKNAIQRFLGEAQNLDDMMSRTVKLLASLTNQVAVIQYPAADALLIKHIELVTISLDSVLVVVVTNSAKVDQAVIKFPSEAPGEEETLQWRNTINDALAGLEYHAASSLLEEIMINPELLDGSLDKEALLHLLRGVNTQLRTSEESKITVAGTANLARAGEAHSDITLMLDAVEEQVTLLRLIQELVEGQHGVGVSIGRENMRYGLPESAFLAADYTRAEEARARLGVFGPTRMDYAKNIAAIRAVSNYLGKFMGDSTI